MSVPLKIWVYKDSQGRSTHGSWSSPPTANATAYHHDDVVRELVEELQAALSYFDHHGITGGSVETTRAALAKIAQEG